MSEYQYYEFAAIDRPLTRAEMAQLRAVSKRAEITPAGFVNHYEWGDLKADQRGIRTQFAALIELPDLRPVLLIPATPACESAEKSAQVADIAQQHAIGVAVARPPVSTAIRQHARRADSVTQPFS